MNKAWGSLLKIAHFSLSIILIRRDVNCKEKMSPAGSWYFKNSIRTEDSIHGH